MTSTDENVRDETRPPNYIRELTGFCTMFAERAGRQNDAPYVRVWLDILSNIIDDEVKARGEMTKMVDESLEDKDGSLPDNARQTLLAVRKYLATEQRR